VFRGAAWDGVDVAGDVSGCVVGVEKMGMNAEQATEIIKLLHSLDHTGYILIAVLSALFGLMLFRK